MDIVGAGGIGNKPWVNTGETGVLSLLPNGGSCGLLLYENEERRAERKAS